MTVAHVHVQIRAPDDNEVGPESMGAALQAELDRRDEELVRLIEERARLARLVSAHRVSTGGSWFEHGSELATVARFHRLGRLGTEMAGLLLRLSRTTAIRSDGPQATV